MNKNRKSNGQTVPGAIIHRMHYRASVWHLTGCVITIHGEKRATERSRAVPVSSPRPVCPLPLSMLKRFVTDACGRSH